MKVNFKTITNNVQLERDLRKISTPPDAKHEMLKIICYHPLDIQLFVCGCVCLLEQNKMKSSFAVRIGAKRKLSIELTCFVWAKKAKGCLLPALLWSKRLCKRRQKHEVV